MFLKRSLSLIPALLAACCAIPALASESSDEAPAVHSVIALKTDDFELVETDISDLAIGESETIVTDNGKTIDLLRTEDGVEVYVDGELLEMSFDSGSAVHAEHEGLHKTIEITCTTEDDCDERVWISDSAEVSAEPGADVQQRHIIRHEITVECDDEEECAEHNVWISEDDEGVMNLEDIEGDLHVIRLHEDASEVQGQAAEKVILIKKKVHHD